MAHLDGNVLAGPATDLFVFEPTMARGQCASCDDIATLSQAMVYGPPMGYVARCRNCDTVLVVIIERGAERSLNMRGLRWLRVLDQAASTASTANRRQ